MQRNRAAAIAAVLVAGLLAVAILLFVAAKEDEIRRPDLPSLVGKPDASLHGTVAYLDGKVRPCVHVLTVSGSWRNDTLQWCAPGRTLRWTTDGFLEHLEFSKDFDTKGRPATDRRGGTAVSGQRIDVRTGTATAVTVADMPATSPPPPIPSLGPRRQRAVAASSNGHVTVSIVRADGSRRRVFSGDGGSLYAVEVLGWAPDGSWILASDGRLLVITTGTRPTTRVLAPDYVGGDSADPPTITTSDVAAG
jgi:hypothetical protein